MNIKKVIYVLVVGIVLPGLFIIRDKKLNSFFLELEGGVLNTL